LLSVNRLFIFSKASLWRGASMPETFSAKKNLGFLSRTRETKNKWKQVPPSQS
jgi:hypothetical protein